MKNKHFNLILSIILIGSMVFTSSANAQEIDNTKTESPLLIEETTTIKDTASAKNNDDATEDADTVTEAPVATPSAITYLPDPYEPNNSFEEAYPYDKTTILDGNAFVDGYRNSNLHSADDVDFFWIYLSAGYTYYVCLKNLYHDYNIELIKRNEDGSVKTWSDFKTGKPEYFYVTPKTSGVYYIKITGNGEPEKNYYFFRVDLAEQTGTYFGPTNLSFLFNGKSTSEYRTFDTTKLIPETAYVTRMEISNDGAKYRGLTKYIKSSSGNVYSNQPGTGIDYIRFGNAQEKAAQKWQIKGSWLGTDRFLWKPYITIDYTYYVIPNIWPENIWPEPDK